MHGDLEELYDLKNDPNENQNIIKLHPEIAEELHQQLSSFIKSLRDKKQRQKILKKKIS